MATATISRGGTSVDLPLIGSGNALTLARDVGKPTQSFDAIGNENPISRDHMNASDAFTISGVLLGTTAYSDAKTLAEDIVKPRLASDSPLQLDLSDLPQRGTYDVAPASGSACRLTYVPGRLDIVGVQLTLNQIASTLGGTQEAPSTITPDSGTGIKLDRNGTTVTLATNQQVTRTVGRPGSKLNPRPDDLPTYHDQNKPAEDVFEISGTLVSPSAEDDALTLEETITRSRLGSDTIDLHFQSNLYGLDAYRVAPTGSQAVRTVFSTGAKGIVEVPKLKLRVVSEL